MGGDSGGSGAHLLGMVLLTSALVEARSFVKKFAVISPAVRQGKAHRLNIRLQ